MDLKHKRLERLSAFQMFVHLPPRLTSSRINKSEFNSKALPEVDEESFRSNQQQKKIMSRGFTTKFPIFQLAIFQIEAKSMENFINHRMEVNMSWNAIRKS